MQQKCSGCQALSSAVTHFCSTLNRSGIDIWLYQRFDLVWWYYLGQSCAEVTRTQLIKGQRYLHDVLGMHHCCCCPMTIQTEGEMWTVFWTLKFISILSWHFFVFTTVNQYVTQLFYRPFSQSTQVSQCQKRTSGLHGAREDQQRQTHRPSGWGPLHPDLPVPTSTIPTFFKGQMPFLLPNQQCQNTEGN